MKFFLLLFTSTSSLQHASYTIHPLLNRNDALSLLEQTLSPTSQYDYRSKLGWDSLKIDRGSSIPVNDPIMERSYGEFPPTSLDLVLDRAEELLDDAVDAARTLTVTDLGSGCGRLCVYMALSRTNYNVQGIEIAEELHGEALESASRAVQGGYAHAISTSPSPSPMEAVTNLSFHCGPAESKPAWLQNSQIVFCYSTVFESSHFDEDIGAMILSEYWNDVLTNHCQLGTVVITTERALDPKRGWTLLDRMEVENREVFGSTAFLQRLDR